jgi:hypothetical protein
MRASRPSIVRRGGPRLVEPPGQPEVGEIDVLVLVEQHVRGLDITVHEALGVGGVQRACHLAADRQCSGRFERTFRAQQLAKVGPDDEAHRQVEAAVDVAGVVDRHHVRMLERHRELGLSGEPLAEAVVELELGRNQLERHRSLEPQVVSPVDDTHPAPADHFLKPIADEISAGAGRQLDHPTVPSACPRILRLARVILQPAAEALLRRR